jgi:hypothetical protein
MALLFGLFHYIKARTEFFGIKARYDRRECFQMFPIPLNPEGKEQN